MNIDSLNSPFVEFIMDSNRKLFHQLKYVYLRQDFFQPVM